MPEQSVSGFKAAGENIGPPFAVFPVDMTDSDNVNQEAVERETEYDSTSEPKPSETQGQSESDSNQHSANSDTVSSDVGRSEGGDEDRKLRTESEWTQPPYTTLGFEVMKSSLQLQQDMLSLLLPHYLRSRGG